MDAVFAERQRFGRFFYRFPDGEAGTDVFDRMCTEQWCPKTSSKCFQMNRADMWPRGARPTVVVGALAAVAEIAELPLAEREIVRVRAAAAGRDRRPARHPSSSTTGARLQP